MILLDLPTWGSVRAMCDDAAHPYDSSPCACDDAQERARDTRDRDSDAAEGEADSRAATPMAMSQSHKENRS